MTPTPTTATPSNTATPSPTATPTEIVFDFPGNDEGWVFSTAAQFVTPASGVGASSLYIQTADNANTFGVWTSPELSLDVPGTVRALGKLYQVEYRMTTDVSSSPLVPTVRVRTNSVDFQRSDVLVATSQLNGDFSPQTSTTTYKMFMERTDAASGPAAFKLNFDVLNFDTTDASVARVDLDYAALRGITDDEALLGTGTPVVAFDFAGGATNGFTTRTAEPTIAGPAFSTTADGITIAGTTARAEFEAIIFGYWGSETAVPLAGNKFYRVDWKVASTATDPTTNPAFRLRVNDSSLKFSQYVNVESTGTADSTPTVGNDKTYSMWVLTPAPIAGNTWIFSFDYLFVPGNGNDSTIPVTLKSLTVTEYNPL